MTTKPKHLIVAGIDVEVVRKNIKHLHLATYPPDGRVRIAVPSHVDDEAVRLAVASKLGWIREQQEIYAEQPRQSTREMVGGESHYVRGRRYRLKVVETQRRQGVQIRGSVLEVAVRSGANAEQRRRLLDRWHREQLRAYASDLVRKWEPRIGVKVNELGIKKMKTRWGTCNPEAGRIWLNLELAKKPPECLEYIVVHEMVHLVERTHNDNFKAHMDNLMPRWRTHRDALNAAPLAHEDWDY